LYTRKGDDGGWEFSDRKKGGVWYATVVGLLIGCGFPKACQCAESKKMAEKARKAEAEENA
jgi:hypothetical protein